MGAKEVHMPVVYVMDPQVRLRRESGRLLVEKKQQLLAQIPLFRLESVFVYGNIQLSMPLLAQLLREGIAVAFFSKYGRFRGRLVGPLDRAQSLRAAQFRAVSDAAVCLQAGSQLVISKIENQRAVLQYAAWHHHELNLAGPLSALENLARKAASAGSREELMGCEGAAARTYFDGLSQLLSNPELRFSERTRRPPRDPVNASLSFGYSLLRSRIESHLHGRGFDVCFGFLHAEHHNQPSLALDIMEPWRPYFVDRLVLRLFNLGILKASDFRPAPGGGLHLTEDAMRRYFEQWESYWQKLDCTQKLRDQVESLTAFVRNPSLTLANPRFIPR